MRKKMNVVLIIAVILGYFIHPDSKGESFHFKPGERYLSITNKKPFQTPQDWFEREFTFQSGNMGNSSDPSETPPDPFEWGLPVSYAQTSWPSMHRDPQNSNYLPFPTTDQLRATWQAIKTDYAAVVAPVILGPEGNIYFTTGKEKDYGNLHAFDQDGREIWRSDDLDAGAFGSAPLLDKDGYIYLGDFDEFFCFSADGERKWVQSDIKGPLVSTVISLNGYIIGINRDGLMYLFDPQNEGHISCTYQLSGNSPGDSYKIPYPPGLWEGMVNEGELNIGDFYNAYKGYQYKITKTAAIHPLTGRILIAGTTSANRGTLYGIDIKSINSNSPIELAFETQIQSSPGTCPSISPDGSHVYVIDKQGDLYAFDVTNGQEVWNLGLDIKPISPTLGSDGTVYVTGDNKLYAIRDLGNSGAIMWEKDFNKVFIENLKSFNSWILQNFPDEIESTISKWRGYLPDWRQYLPDVREYIPDLFEDVWDWAGDLPRLREVAPEWLDEFSELIEDLLDHGIEPAVVSNSIISASKNFLYLTLALGYEDTIPGTETTWFVPVRSFLVVLKPTYSSLKPYAAIQSVKALPDTTEGTVTLDKDGNVYCTHASIGSSVAYFVSKELGTNFPKPSGGVTVFEPKSSKDLIGSQIECTSDSIRSIQHSLAAGDTEVAYKKVGECMNQLKLMEDVLLQGVSQGVVSASRAQMAIKGLENAYLQLESAQNSLEPIVNHPEYGWGRATLQARSHILSAIIICRYVQALI